MRHSKSARGHRVHVNRLCRKGTVRSGARRRITPAAPRDAAVAPPPPREGRMMGNDETRGPSRASSR